MLESEVERLLTVGVEVVPVSLSSEKVRLNGRERGRVGKRLFSRVTKLFDRLQWRSSKLPFRQFLNGQPVTIFSHEDQLGFTQDLLRVPFYHCSERWAILDRLAGSAQLEIFLSVRSFDTLFASAFCEILKPFPDARRRLETRLATLQESPPSWAELAHRIADRYPMAKVHVWRFEDYTTDPGFVFKSLTGVDMRKTKDEVPTKTRSQSPLGIELAETLDASLDIRTRMEAVQQIFNAHPKSRGEKIRLLRESEIIFLRDLYQRDIEEIAKSDRLHLMPPTPKRSTGCCDTK